MNNSQIYIGQNFEFMIVYVSEAKSQEVVVSRFQLSMHLNPRYSKNTTICSGLDERLDLLLGSDNAMWHVRGNTWPWSVPTFHP